MNRLNNIISKSSKISSIFSKNILKTLTKKYHTNTNSMYYSDNLFTNSYNNLYNKNRNDNYNKSYSTLITNSFNGINLIDKDENENKDENKDENNNNKINFISKENNTVNYNNVKKCILFIVYYYLLYFLFGKLITLLFLLYDVSCELNKEEYIIDTKTIYSIKFSN